MNRFPRNVFVLGDRRLCPTQICDEYQGIQVYVIIPATVLGPGTRRILTGGAYAEVPGGILQPLGDA